VAKHAAARIPVKILFLLNFQTLAKFAESHNYVDIIPDETHRRRKKPWQIMLAPVRKTRCRSSSVVVSNSTAWFPQLRTR
jgi:hypothetical protein